MQGQNAEVFIRIRTKETQADTNKRIDEAMNDIEKGDNNDIIVIASIKGHYEDKKKHLVS